MGLFSRIFSEKKLPAYMPPVLPPQESITAECNKGTYRYGHFISEYVMEIIRDVEEEEKNTTIPYWWDTEDPPILSNNEKSFVKRIKGHKDFALYLKSASKNLDDLDIYSLRSIAVEAFILDEWLFDNDERFSDVINYLDSIEIKPSTPFSMFYLFQIANQILDNETGKPTEFIDIAKLRNQASRLLDCSKDMAIDLLFPEL